MYFCVFFILLELIHICNGTYEMKFKMGKNNDSMSEARTQARTGLIYQKRVFTTVEKYDIVRLHNFYRRSTNPTASNMQLMTWDDELASIATENTDLCTWNDDTWIGNHQDHGRDVSALLLLTSDVVTDGSLGVHAVHSWADDQTYYNPLTGSCSFGKCLYRQIISADAYEIGCGLTSCSTIDGATGLGTIVMCLYAPGAENIGDAAFTEGEPCSALFDKCLLQDCYNKLCTDLSDSSAREWNAYGYLSSIETLSKSDMDEIVEQHNKVRRNVQPASSNMRFITWADGYSFDYDDMCDATGVGTFKTQTLFGDVVELSRYDESDSTISYLHAFVHDTFWRSRVLQESVELWGEGGPTYNVYTGSCIGDKKACDIFRHLVTSSISEVECAMAECSGVERNGALISGVAFRCKYENTVVSYLPVYAIGTPCGSCSGSFNNCFRDLCTGFTDDYLYAMFPTTTPTTTTTTTTKKTTTTTTTRSNSTKLHAAFLTEVMMIVFILFYYQCDYLSL